MKRVLLVAVAVVVAAAGWLAFQTQQATGPAERPGNVILIVMDTFRADRLGCHGNPTGLTPNLDRFAGGAVRFNAAFAAAPWTLPSMASLYTSQHPVQHGAGGYMGKFQSLPDDAVTVAEVFDGAGAETRAIVNVLFLTDRPNMTQGFDVVDADAPESNVQVRRAEPTTDLALRWLDELGDRPFFLLVHYFDAHLVYDPPQPYRERYADPRDKNTSDFVFGTRPQMMGLRNGSIQLTAAAVARLEKLYNGEIAYLDAEIGRLLEGIAARGLNDDTVVAITADHGEEFWDHDGFEHGHTHYDELLHVPLMIRAPGLDADIAGRVVRSTVRLIDVAPTLCELANVPPATDFVGRSLVNLMRGTEEPDRPVIAQGNLWGPSRDSLRHDDRKVIRHNQGELAQMAAAKNKKLPDSVDLRARYEFYDLAADPSERQNLALVRPELCQGLIGELELALGAMTMTEGEAPDFSDDELQMLEALGYIHKDEATNPDQPDEQNAPGN